MRKGFFLDVLFPPRCLSCRAFLGEDTGLCAECASLVPVRRYFFCAECRTRLPHAVRPHCHPRSFTLGAATDYGNPVVAELIRRTKFDCVKSGAALLGHLAAHYVDFSVGTLPVDIVVPVPLGTLRMKERGFNQAESIARVIAERCAIPLDTHSLVRVRDTLPQSTLSEAADREENVKECFSVADPRAFSKKHVLLVDDVATSGATLGAAVAALKNSGSVRVIALVAAIAG